MPPEHRPTWASATCAAEGKARGLVGVNMWWSPVSAPPMSCCSSSSDPSIRKGHGPCSSWPVPFRILWLIGALMLAKHRRRYAAADRSGGAGALHRQLDAEASSSWARQLPVDQRRRAPARTLALTASPMIPALASSPPPATSQSAGRGCGQGLSASAGDEPDRWPRPALAAPPCQPDRERMTMTLSRRQARARRQLRRRRPARVEPTLRELRVGWDRVTSVDIVAGAVCRADGFEVRNGYADARRRRAPGSRCCWRTTTTRAPARGRPCLIDPLSADLSRGPSRSPWRGGGRSAEGCRIAIWSCPASRHGAMGRPGCRRARPTARPWS